MTPPYLRHLNSWGDTVFLAYISVAGAGIVFLWLCVFAKWGMQ